MGLALYPRRPEANYGWVFLASATGYWCRIGFRMALGSRAEGEVGFRAVGEEGSRLEQ